MATPPPTTLTGAQQQQQHQVRRLTTIRQFQERQRQRHEECLELRRLLHRCEEDAELEKGMLRGDAATLAEFAAIERRVEQGIEATRKYLPASAPEVSTASRVPCRLFSFFLLRTAFRNQRAHLTHIHSHSPLSPT